MKRILTVLFVCAAFVSCGDDVTYEYKDIDNPVPEYTPTLSGKAVSDAEELAKIGVNDEYPPDGEYYLSCDIDLTQIEWTPIGGSADTPFSGLFHGNNKKITGLKLNAGDGTRIYNGLFGYIQSARIDNLEISITNTKDQTVLLSKDEGTYTETTQYIGALAGYAISSNITGVTVKGTDGAELHSVKSGDGSLYAGGVFGYVNSSVLQNIISEINITTETSAFDAIISNICSCTGGIAGYVRSDTIFSECIAQDIAVKASASTNLKVYTGGLAGQVYQSTVFRNCVSSVTKVRAESSGTGDKYSGGLAGYAECGITNCSLVSDASIEAASTGTFETGTLEGSVYAGGIAGDFRSVCSGNYVNGETVIKADSAGTGFVYAGGLAGSISFGDVSNSYVSGGVKVLVTRTNTGSDTGSQTMAGGFAGWGGNITNCYSFADIQITTSVAAKNTNYITAGGLLGLNTGGLTNCYSGGKAEIINTHPAGNVCAGGIAGLLADSASASIEHCFAANSAITVTSSNTSNGAVTVNRIAAKKLGTTNGTLERNYASPALVIKKIINGSESDIPQTNNINDVCGSSNLGVSGADESFFSGTLGWDFTNIWTWDSALGMPVLR